MKRILMLLLLVMLPCLAFADNSETVWLNNDLAVNDRYGAHYSFDLSQTYYIPKISVNWNESNENGTINAFNYWGQFGTKNCSHRLKVTFTSNQKFISQSDPTKYRDFDISVHSEIIYTGNADSDNRYRWYASGLPHTTNGIRDNGYAITDYWPNTVTNGSPFVYYTPITDGQTAQMTNSNESHVVNTYWSNLLINLQPLTTEDQKHMHVADDYIAEIQVSWECADDPDCTIASHSGSRLIRLRGFYGSADTSDDYASIYIAPNSNATNIDIETLARTGNSLNIGTLQVHTTTATNNYQYGGSSAYDWNSNLHVFAASTDNPTSAGQPFTLKRVSGGTQTEIPFTVTIVDSNNPSSSITFDGTDSYSTSTYKVRNNKNIPLGTPIQSEDRYGNKYNEIHYYGDILINITGTIPERSDISYSQNYSGTYSSIIYFILVCNK